MREKWRTSKFTILITWLVFPSMDLTEHKLAIKTAGVQHCRLYIFTLSAASPIWPKGTQKRMQWNVVSIHPIFAFLATDDGMHSAHEKFGYICFGFALFSVALGLFGSRWRPVQDTGCISVCKPCWHKKSLQENGTKLVSELNLILQSVLWSVRTLPALKYKKYWTKRHMFVVLCFLARSSDVVVFYNL